MALAYINLSVKQYFNFMGKTDFERRIYHDTYKEFQKKSKNFSAVGTVNTFSEMLATNPKASTLHQKLQLVVLDAISTLDKKIPVLADMSGNSILFNRSELYINQSDLANKAAHVISINYTSPQMVLHEIVGDLLILSYHIKGQFNNTFMVKMTDDVVITYEQIPEMAYT